MPPSLIVCRDDRDARGPTETNMNPGNNLYITGLSTRVTEEQLLAHFAKEGKVGHNFHWYSPANDLNGCLLIHLARLQVTECRLVKDPRTHESRGFGFVTMGNVDDAEYAVRNLNRSTLEGRAIVVEKVSDCLLALPVPDSFPSPS